MPLMLDRELQLGADTVVRRDQQRIGEPRRAQIEEAAESAEVRVRARPPRRAGEGAMARTSALPLAIETPASA